MEVHVNSAVSKESKELSLEEAKLALRLAIADGDISAIDDIMMYHKNDLLTTVPNNLVKMLQTGNCYFGALTHMVNEYDFYLFNSTISVMCGYYNVGLNNESFDTCIDKIRGKLYTEDLSLMYLRGEYELLERAIIVGVELDTLNVCQIKSLHRIAASRQMTILYDVMSRLCEGIDNDLFM